MTTIADIRKATRDEVDDLLEQYGRCCIIRPTGFGKTYLLTDLIKSYGNVTFLYPKKVIRDSVLVNYESTLPPDVEADNVRFVSYQKLARNNPDLIAELADSDLIICDEAHILGAIETGRAFTSLLEELAPDVHIVGATATPWRSDTRDFLAFFHNVTTSPFSLHDAFECGMIQRPYYFYNTYDGDDIDEMSEAAKLEIEKIMDPNVRAQQHKLLSRKQIEVADIMRMPNIIKDVCDAHAPSTDYMKFIVFFSRFDALTELSPNVVDWFHEAYPNHTIKTLEISSRTKETTENLELLGTMSPRPLGIDLIFTIDMLNLGYHVSDLTGICMYRGTSSSICFAQQLGRALSSGTDDHAIVFDWVDNLHRKSLFQILGHEKAKTLADKNRYLVLRNIAETNPIAMTPAEQIEFEHLCRRFEQTNMWISLSDSIIDPTDLIAEAHAASPEQLRLKLEAEPIAARLRTVWDQWIENGGDPDPMNMAAIISQTPPAYIPLAPFAAANRVSAYDVMKIMGVYENMTKTEVDKLADEMTKRCHNTRRPSIATIPTAAVI